MPKPPANRGLRPRSANRDERPGAAAAAAAAGAGEGDAADGDGAAAAGAADRDQGNEAALAGAAVGASTGVESAIDRLCRRGDGWLREGAACARRAAGPAGVESKQEGARRGGEGREMGRAAAEAWLGDARNEGCAVATPPSMHRTNRSSSAHESRCTALGYGARCAIPTWCASNRAAASIAHRSRSASACAFQAPAACASVRSTSPHTVHLRCSFASLRQHRTARRNRRRDEQAPQRPQQSRA